MLTKLPVALLFIAISSYAQNNPVKDESFTTKEYMLKEIPSPDRNWGSSEYLFAVSILEDITAAHPEILPLRNSKKSGEVFARLTSTQNLISLTDSSLSLGSRLGDFTRYSTAFPRLMRLYYDPNAQKQKYGAEVISVMIFGLKVMQDGMNIVHAMRKGKQTDEEEKGYAEMEKGMLAFTKNGLTALGKTEAFNKEDLISLSEKLKPFMEQTWVYHDKNARQEITAAIQNAISKTDYEEVRSNLSGLQLK